MERMSFVNVHNTVVYLFVFVLGDDASMSEGSFILTKYIYVLIHIRNKGVVGTIKLV